MNLTRNEYLIKRMLLLRNLEPPTISDAKENFGDLLSDIIFCQCEPEFKTDLGLEPHLKGIGEELWTSPSDLLIGKVCLKPPLTSKHIRALTHRGILDIGQRIERLFWNQIELEKSKELEEQDRTLRLLCETEKKEAVKDAQKKMRYHFQNERMDLINEMDVIHNEEIKQLQLKFLRDLKEELKEQEKELEKYYAQKVEEEVSKTSEVITLQSNGELEELESNMKKIYSVQLQKSYIQAKFNLEQEKAISKENIKKLRHELECKNMANMMYIICMERRKCLAERDQIESKLTETIKDLGGILKKKDQKLKELQEQQNKLKYELELREKCVNAIVKEFQKFIYFSLKSYPKQAEYLLSAEKLMAHELSKAFTQVEEEKSAQKESDHDRNYLWNKWPGTPTDSKESDLFVEDHHKCLSESERSDSELSTEALLAGFYFNDQLFVREDFRNMLSQNMKIDETDLLWTKHIQDIQDKLDIETPSCIFNKEERFTNVEKQKSNFSYQSSVHFSSNMRDKFSNYSVMNKEIHKTSLRNAAQKDILQNINFNKIGSEEKRKTLISARSSLEVFRESLMKKKSSVQIEKSPRTNGKEIVEEIETELTDNFSEETEIQQNNFEASEDESLKEYKATDYKTPLSIDDTADYSVRIPVNNSRLSVARDSLELIKDKKEESIKPKASYMNEIVAVNKNIKCILSDCNVLKYKTSSEILVEKQQIEKYQVKDTDSTVSKDEFRNLRRQSVGFTSQYVIYDKEKVKDETNESFEEKPRKTKSSTKSGSKLKNANKPSKTKNEEQETTKDIIMGDSNINIFLQRSDEFTTDRIHSFINIIKEYPNLMRLFTSVTR